MPISASSPGSTNRLLALLPPSEYQRLLPALRFVQLDLHQVLYDVQSPLDFVYFPNLGTVVSMILLMEDGTAIEAATIGNEGVLEVSALLGETTAFARYLVQVPGSALRMRAEVFRQETQHKGSLRQLVLLYQSAFIKQISQGVACNGLHTVQQRCCRWLLMTRDRSESATFAMTHEFLSHMLGVRRSSVTEVLQPLREKGLLQSVRGKVTILDQKGLESLSCECYRTVRDEFEMFFSKKERPLSE